MPIDLKPPRAGKTPYWYGRGSYLGVRINRSTQARTKRLALKVVAKWQADIERGEFAAAPELTFAQAALAYIQAGGEMRFLGPLLRHFKETPLRKIGQVEIDLAAAALYPAATPATLNRNVYTPVSAILKRAGRDYDFRLRRPVGAQGRRLSDWLWPEQAFRLFAQARRRDPELAILIEFLVYTGLRLGEALRVGCDDLRLKERFIYVRMTKNGDPQPVYLPPRLVVALANHPRKLARAGERVFRFHKGSALYAALDAAAKAAGVTLPARQKFHLFRHTYATWMRRYGNLDTKALQATGRWKDRKSVDRYEHVVASEEARRAARLPTPRRKKRGLARKNATSH